ncbi:MAG TPA: MmgE/PrpD family protein [Ramlibacter sp.]|nr:MmgE/PrpD family protein [Ramlibacter sp.]
MDATTSRLTDFASAPLPCSPAVTHEAKRRLIDSMACALGAWHTPLCQAARAVAGTESAEGSAALWGLARRSSPEAAAFANGTLVRALDLSDMYRVRSGGHPSDVIAAVIAVADATRASGRDTLEAIVLAYEFYCTFCEAIDINTLGWDQPLYAAIASAAGAARVLGLRGASMAHAISLAVAPNLALAQTRRGRISSWKGAAAANAARNGVFAARLAQAGVSGPADVFEGSGGLFEALGAFDWRIGHGQPRILSTNLKRFPVCYHGQGAAAAAIELRSQVAPQDVTGLRVDTYAQAVTYMANEPSRWAPATRETADHSLPYVVAVALSDGDVTEHSFDEDRLADPALQRLMACTRVVEDEAYSARYPASAPCRLTIELRDGTARSVEVPSPEGHCDRPMSDAAVDAKFLGLAAEVIPAPAARRLLDALWGTDQAPGIRDVLSCFPAIEGH